MALKYDELKAEIEADPVGLGYGADDYANAALLSDQTKRTRTKTVMTRDQFYNTFTVVLIAVLQMQAGALQTKWLGLKSLLDNCDTINPASATMQGIFAQMVSDHMLDAYAGQTNRTPAQVITDWTTEPCSRARELWDIDSVSYDDILTARRQ